MAGGVCIPARSFNWRAGNDGRPWTATLPALQRLHDFGIGPCSELVRRAVALVTDNCRWEHAGQSFFSGEVGPCINGRTVAEFILACEKLEVPNYAVYDLTWDSDSKRRLIELYD